MRRSNLFTKAETETLQAYAGRQQFLAVSWAMAEVKAAILRDRPSDGEVGEVIDPPQLTTMPQLAIYQVSASTCPLTSPPHMFSELPTLPLTS